MSETVSGSTLSHRAFSRQGALRRAVVAMGRFFRQQPTGAAGAFFILILALAGFFAPWVAPYDPLAIDFMNQLAPPSLEHLAGTDPFGRDILSRLVHGARTALTIALSAAFLGCTMGALLGVTSAYFGGKVDMIIQRFVDILLSFPIIVLALVVVSVFGHLPILGIDLNLIIAIAIPMIPKVARVIRSAALAVIVMPYIDAARAMGFSHRRIILRHMAVNLVAPYLIMFTSYVAQAIQLEAALSFLGLGVAEPTPAWGLMLSGNAAEFFAQAPWVVIFPGLAISLTVFAFNMYGDALRDWLDPRLKT